MLRQFASDAWKLGLGLTLVVATQVRAADRPRPPAGFHEAMEACLSENGINRPAPGARPSDADRQVVDSCLVAKGFARPPGGPHGHRPPPPHDGDDAVNPPPASLQ